MKKRKVCAVVINRANYGRVKLALKAIREHPQLELQLIVGSSMLLSRFGEAVNIIKLDGFKIDARVNFVVEGQTPATMAISTGLGIVELATMFENMRPDVVFVIADRYDALSAAVASTYMNIPVAHLQGGEITGSIDESVRHAITRLSHIHFPATELSARRLIMMGESPDTVHPVGCPSIDLVCEAMKYQNGNGLDKISSMGSGGIIDPQKPYLLVLQHPVTTEHKSSALQIEATLQAVSQLEMQAIILMPNVDAGGKEMEDAIYNFRQNCGSNFLRFFQNFNPEDYGRVLAGAACIIGNSSSALREASFLGTPAVTIGSRQNGRERGPNVISTNYSTKEIVAAVHKQLRHGRYEKHLIYGSGQASQNIADILATADFRLQKKLNL